MNIDYSNSAPDPDLGISVDDHGSLQYASAAATGNVEVVLPALPGAPRSETRMLAKNFGVHVIAEIEKSLTRQPYLQSSPRQTPTQVFRHFVACARGSGLLDPGALKNMEALAKEFEADPEPQEFFAQVAKPYLLSLAPKRR